MFVDFCFKINEKKQEEKLQFSILVFFSNTLTLTGGDE